MDRRTLLTSRLKRQPDETPCIFPPLSSGAGLTPYNGSWQWEQAAHLLRRTMFGPSNAQINWSVEKGMNATIDKLLEHLPLPEPPLNVHYRNDPAVPVGSTWINAPFTRANLVEELSYRALSLLGWTMGLILEEGISIREKMTLFWHNHFAINSVSDPKFKYRYISLLRNNALGNFRTLTKAITIDPAMLSFLNGNRNTHLAPNENYARELLELFTIGKGPLIAEGDYTHYTEKDVKEIARVLSGWTDYGATVESTDGKFGAFFKPSAHDRGVKKLSHHFNNVEITDKGDTEYAHLIDIIFQQAEVARFICRRLYRWLVYYHLDEQVENNVIQPMADIMLMNNFEIKPALRALLSSEHFYDKVFRGAMIKHPLDFMMSIFKPLQIKISQVPDEKYYSWYRLFGLARTMQMEYYQIPEVAGWRAYYVAPGYYRAWINATTLPFRAEFARTTVLEGYFPFQAKGPQMKPDVLALVATLKDPFDPNRLVEDLANLFLPQPLSANEKAKLKSILLPGLPDYEWGVEYQAYLDNPVNSQLASALEAKLRALLVALFSKAAFQLC